MPIAHGARPVLPSCMEDGMRRGQFAAWMGITAVLTLGTAVPAPAAPGKPPPTAARPAPVTSMASALRQTAAIVEGLVTDIRYEFSEADGPWTVVTLSGVKAHVGTAPNVLQIRHFGGRLPNGRMMVAAELPVFVKGKPYVVFLRNTAWNLSPVVGDLALRVETVGEAQVLVNSDGQPVVGVGAQGVRTGRALFDGPQLDGSAPPLLAKAKAGHAEPAAAAAPQPQQVGVAAEAAPGPAAAGEQPLTPAAFLARMNGMMVAEKAAVGGTFYELPAGAFRWRAQPTSQAPGKQAPPGGPGGGRPEIDTSGPGR